MLRIAYNAFNHEHMAFKQRLDQLMELYQTLLNKAAGDAEQALDWLDYLAERYNLWGDGLDRESFEQILERDGQITKGPTGQPRLSPKGEQFMRSQALEQLFGDLSRNAGPGDHAAKFTGSGGEIQPTTRPWEFGDELWQINPTETLNNAVKSSIGRGLSDVNITEDDLMVYDSDATTQCATALLIDCSHSMVLYGEDRMSAARSVAMGLVEFIKNKFPRDRLYIIGFGDDAFEVSLKDLPYLSYGEWHTNTKAALELGRNLLTRSRCPNRQIFMVTDGKPTVLDDGARRIIDSGWLNPRIVNRTLDEAAQCRRKRIPITTFMMASDPYLMQFVEDLTEINQGRAYYTGMGKLGQYLMVDYVKNRQRKVR